MTEKNKSSKTTKSVSRINFRKVLVDIICECQDCSFTATSVKDMQKHVMIHFQGIFTNSFSNTNSMEIMCRICGDTLPDESCCIRHACYHVYHFNLKARGRYIKKLHKLPDCHLDKCSSNIIPPLTNPFICQWNGCSYKNDDITDFYDHVDDHPFYEGDPDNQSVFECKWSDCSYQTVTAYRLLNHMAVHCEKRYIACPNCGLCFATTSKFSDHLNRQIVNVWNKEMQEKEMNMVLTTLAENNNPVIPLPKPVVEPPSGAYKCNICKHLYATKQMLKNHETRHISTVVCPHCNILCSCRYALKRHILFRHTEEKPFKCEECGHAFKCNDVLKRHTQQCHHNENFCQDLRCDAPECTFKAKSKLALNIHKSRMHCKIQTIVTKVYVCHKCDQEYVKGSLLTIHLSKDHGIKKTANRYRHQYKICEDGKYRLNMFDLKLKSAVKDSRTLSTNVKTELHVKHENLQTNFSVHELQQWTEIPSVFNNSSIINVQHMDPVEMMDENDWSSSY